MSDLEFDQIYAEFERSIISSALRHVAQHWRSICRPGRLPRWSDIRPAQIKAELPIVWCYDYDHVQDDFVGRLAGIAITGVSNKPFKGTKLSELRPDDNYPRALVRSRRIVREPALYRGYGLVYKIAESCGLGERIAMPLAGEGPARAGTFGATEYKALREWKPLSPEDKTEREFWFPLAAAVGSPLAE